MAIVYVTQDVPQLDYEPALIYGEKLVAVFPPGGQIRLSPQNALGQARKVLADLTAADWLCLAGDPVMIGICVAVAVEKVGKVRLLRFNRRELNYTPVEVDFLDRIPA